jgi:hypothetical protein
MAQGKLTGRDDRADLHDHVVRCGSDGSFLDVEAVFADPCGDNWMEVRVCHQGQLL